MGPLIQRVFRSGVAHGTAGKQYFAETKNRAFPSQCPCSSNLTLNFTVGNSWRDAIWSVHFYQDVTVKACTTGCSTDTTAQWTLISFSPRGENAMWMKCPASNSPSDQDITMTLVTYRQTSNGFHLDTKHNLISWKSWGQTALATFTHYFILELQMVLYWWNSSQAVLQAPSGLT